MELARFPSSNNPPLENFPLFEHLPVELALKIFSYLGPKELLLATRVCSLFNQHCRDDTLWKGLLLRDRPFERVRGGSCLQAYVAAEHFRINTDRSRYTVEEVTLNRENTGAAAQWEIFGVYNDRLYAVTAQKTVEIWDLHTRQKVGNDIPVQGTDTKACQISFNSQMVWIVFGDGIGSFNHLKGGELAFQRMPISPPLLTPSFFTACSSLGLTDTVRVTYFDNQIRVAGHEKEELIEAENRILDLFIRDNILYALTSERFVERWELSTLNPLEKMDVNIDRNNEPEQIIGVGKNGKVVIGYAAFYSIWPMVSWDLESRAMIKKVNRPLNNRPFSRWIEVGDLLFCIDDKNIVEVRDLVTLEVKSQFIRSRLSLTCSEKSDIFFHNYCRDGYKIYLPKKWDRVTNSPTLEIFDFLPEDKALENKGQIALRQQIRKAADRDARDREIENRLNVNSCGDCCWGLLSALGLCCVAMAMDALEDAFEYLWDRFCDLTEWVSSFFGEGEEEEVQDIGPPLLIPLPQDRPADNNGNNI